MNVALQPAANLAGSREGDYDDVVVGGGIGGVCTAICLAESGRRVLLVEETLLGTGASGSTLFAIHSGAKYSLDRPALARDLASAAPLWNELPVGARTDNPTRNQQTWLITGRRLVYWRLRLALLRLGIPSTRVPLREIATVLRPAKAGSQYAIGVGELAVSPRRTMEHLAQRCLDLSPLLTVSVGEQVQTLLLKEQRVVGVKTDLRTISAANVVLASGSGTLPLLDSIDSPAKDRIVAPQTVAVMVANHGLDVGVHSLDVGGPVAIPDGTSVAVSVLGAEQPPRVPGQPVAHNEQLAARKIEQAAEWFEPSLIDTSDSGYISAEKPEFHTAATPVPGTSYARDSSMAVSRIADGLVLVMVGKYTLGPVAGQAACRLINGSQTKIPNPLRSGNRVTQAAVDMVHPMPWLAPPGVISRQAQGRGVQ